MQPHSPAGESSAASEYPLDLRPLPDPIGLRETLPGDIRTSAPVAGSVGLLLVGSRKLEPTLGPPPLQDEATALRLHAGAKAELSSSTDLAGLVGSLHFPGSLGCMGDGQRIISRF